VLEEEASLRRLARFIIFTTALAACAGAAAAADHDSDKKTDADKTANADGGTTTAAAEQKDATPTSPLAIHVGDADLLIGGFMDMTAVMRSTTTGNGLGTSFGS